MIPGEAGESPVNPEDLFTRTWAKWVYGLGSPIAEPNDMPLMGAADSSGWRGWMSAISAGG